MFWRMWIYWWSLMCWHLWKLMPNLYIWLMLYHILQQRIWQTAHNALFIYLFIYLFILHFVPSCVIMIIFVLIIFICQCCNGDLPLGVVFCWLLRKIVWLVKCTLVEMAVEANPMKWECPFVTVCLQWIELTEKCFWDFNVKNMLQG